MVLYSPAALTNHCLEYVIVIWWLSDWENPSKHEQDLTFCLHFHPQTFDKEPQYALLKELFIQVCLHNAGQEH